MKALSVATYAALRKKIAETLLLGQQKIEAAKVQTYWDTGYFINQHIRVNGGRAEYGQKIVQRLAEDIDLHPSVLQRCSQFAEIFPDFKIVATWRQLAWVHFRILMTIPAKKIREEFARCANREHWTVAKLQQTVLFKVRNLLCDESGKILEGKSPSLLPVPVLGPFYTYPIIRLESIHGEVPSLVLDNGFSLTTDLEDRFPSCHYPEGTIVTSVRNARGNYSLAELGKRGTGNASRHSLPVNRSPLPALLYTYKAYVKTVIDGDTLKVCFDAGFGEKRTETIRLKGIDCPEMDTPEGRRAKKIVEDELSGCEWITVKSTKTPRKEKWGRYLADVFYANKEGKQICLNNLLLEKGHAVRVRE